jgi:hypothetical protein
VQLRLSYPNSEFKLHLAHAIRSIDPHDQKAIEVLCDLLKDSKTSVQDYTLYALEDLGTNARPAIPAVEDYIQRQTNAPNKELAASTLQRLAGSNPPPGEFLPFRAGGKGK